MRQTVDHLTTSKPYGRKLVLGETSAFPRGDICSMANLYSKLLKDDGGATAIEYGLIAALIAVAAIAAFQLVGTNLSGIFNSVATQL